VIKVADEVWIATALLHREQPHRATFSVNEIMDRAYEEGLARPLRPGVQIHASQHCVANRRPNPGKYRMLYAPPEGGRRLFRGGDDYHPYREGGKFVPREDEIPGEYRYLLEWYETEYAASDANGAARARGDESSICDSGTVRRMRPWERALALARELAPAELEDLPDDIAEQHDHYAWGVPKGER
jgi:hypothetical protein